MGELKEFGNEERDMDTVEARLTALERKAKRYRNAFSGLAAMLAGVVLVGATTDDIQEVVETKALHVVNEAGQNVLSAFANEEGDGMLIISEHTGRGLMFAKAVDGVSVRSQVVWHALRRITDADRRQRGLLPRSAPPDK